MVERRRANQVGINNLHYKLFKCPIVNGFLKQKNSFEEHLTSRDILFAFISMVHIWPWLHVPLQ